METIKEANSQQSDDDLKNFNFIDQYDSQLSINFNPSENTKQPYFPLNN
jgi:hypothetical protein